MSNIEPLSTFKPVSSVLGINKENSTMPNTSLCKNELRTEDFFSMQSQHIQPKLQNIVATVNLNSPLNLKQIALQARNAEYNP